MRRSSTPDDFPLLRDLETGDEIVEQQPVPIVDDVAEPSDELRADAPHDADTIDPVDDDTQPTLFEMPPGWKSVWAGMPEYSNEDLRPIQTVKVHFRDLPSRDAFAALVGETLSDRTQFIWYPKNERAIVARRRWASTDTRRLKYPVYIVSKGRWDSRLTARALDTLGVPFHIVVEPQEAEQYAAVIDPARVLVLPFSNLGQGSIPARNWIWEHACAHGATRHWILDDNIRAFYRFHKNLKVRASSGLIFRAAEDFADRYQNVALCGFNYHFFAKRKFSIPPYTMNTRIYSCILIRNDLPFRWRGRYNEDTDLSLRVLKSGLCTVLFNAFLAGKEATMTMRGGNTDELYQGDGRRQMAESLHEQHPDVVRITRKFNRWQHHVDYHRFSRNALIPAGDVPPEDAYDMQLVSADEIEEVAR